MFLFVLFLVIGHEAGLGISLAAALMGATVIERHFTLDKQQKVHFFKTLQVFVTLTFEFCSYKHAFKSSNCYVLYFLRVPITAVHLIQRNYNYLVREAKKNIRVKGVWWGQSHFPYLFETFLAHFLVKNGKRQEIMKRAE